MGGLMDVMAAWPDWWLPAALAACALIHEDVALVAGAFAATSGRVSAGLAYASILAGIMIGDAAIYALGFIARQHPALRRLLIRDRVERFGRWMDRSLFRLVLACKITPGLLFPMYAAYGWFGISFPRFFLVSLLISAMYSVTLFAILVVAGHAFLHAAGPWLWILLMGSILMASAMGTRKPRWSRVDTLVNRPMRVTDVVSRADRALHARFHRGMPSLVNLRRHIAEAERIPPTLFYLPLLLHWMWLGLRYRSITLPSAANPSIEGGGFWGESKSHCMDLVSGDQRSWMAPYRAITRRDTDATDAEIREATEFMAVNTCAYPVVAKPDIGWQGYGAQLVSSDGHLRAYIRHFPPEATFLVQEHIPWDGEAGVFYIRRPDEPHGHLHSLTLRYFPHVQGDGTSTLKQLVLRGVRSRWKAHLYFGESEEHAGFDDTELNRIPADGELVRLAFIGSIRTGGLYRDASAAITPAMTERFDAIARSMRDFYFGRFDIRFRSLEHLQRGEGFRIIEINGAGSEDIHVWDPEKRVREVYSGLIQTQRALFEVAALNRARGFKPMPLRPFLSLARRQHRLIKRYPKSM